MGLQREKITSTPTFKTKVLVQFPMPDGTVTQGDFTGEFKRLGQLRLDELMDADEAYRNSEVLEEVLIGVAGISDTGTTELPADEQLTWVKQTPECVSAAVAAFFKVMRPERYDAKTSKTRRSRG